MNKADITLIKMITDHYWIKRDHIVEKRVHNGRTFFDKYERIDSMLSTSILNQHERGEISVAHSLISASNKVENIVFDYNGRNTDRFWHRAQLLLREEGFINFTAYESKTPGHLHLYVHKGHTTLQEAFQIGQMLSMKLSTKLPREWKMFPSADIPREFNILSVPYDTYNKERGASWSKHM